MAGQQVPCAARSPMDPPPWLARGTAATRPARGFALSGRGHTSHGSITTAQIRSTDVGRRTCTAAPRTARRKLRAFWRLVGGLQPLSRTARLALLIVLTCG